MLEVLGNLESTGMVPRERKEKPRKGSVRNFLEAKDFSSIVLRPSPVDSDKTIPDEFEKFEDSGNLDIPVTDDSYQVYRGIYYYFSLFLMSPNESKSN